MQIWLVGLPMNEGIWKKKEQESWRRHSTVCIWLDGFVDYPGFQQNSCGGQAKVSAAPLYCDLETLRGILWAHTWQVFKQPCWFEKPSSSWENPGREEEQGWERRSTWPPVTLHWESVAYLCIIAIGNPTANYALAIACDPSIAIHWCCHAIVSDWTVGLRVYATFVH